MKNINKELGLNRRSKLFLCGFVLVLISVVLLIFREMDDRTVASLEQTIKKRNIGQPKMEHVIQPTIELANMLDLQPVAEGVETQQQVDFLIPKGCYYAQGYFYSKPVLFEDYLKMLKEQGTVSSQNFPQE